MLILLNPNHQAFELKHLNLMQNTNLPEVEQHHQVYRAKRRDKPNAAKAFGIPSGQKFLWPTFSLKHSNQFWNPAPAPPPAAASAPSSLYTFIHQSKKIPEKIQNFQSGKKRKDYFGEKISKMYKYLCKREEMSSSVTKFFLGFFGFSPIFDMFF